MRIRTDYATVAFLLDLPDDVTVTGVEADGDGLVFLAEAPDHYPDDCVAAYAADDDGNVSLIGFAEPE